MLAYKQLWRALNLAEKLVSHFGRVEVRQLIDGSYAAFTSLKSINAYEVWSNKAVRIDYNIDYVNSRHICTFFR